MNIPGSAARSPRTPPRGRSATSSLLALALLAACGRDLPTVGLSRPGEDPVGSPLTLSPAELSLYRGQRFVLAATKAGRTVIGEPGFSLVSTNPDVVLVEPSGAGRAVDPGSGEIVASLGGETARTTVVVNAAALVGIAIEPAALEVEAGETVSFTVRGRLDDGGAVDLTPSPDTSARSSAPGVMTARVGSITGVSAGRAVLEVSHERFFARADVEVVAAPVEDFVRLEVKPSRAELGFRDTLPLGVTAYRQDGRAVDVLAAGLPVTFTTSNRNFATVTARGVVTAGQREGEATITARLGELRATAVLQIRREPTVELVGLELDPAADTVIVGDSGRLTAIGVYSDGSRRPITGGGVAFEPPLPPTVLAIDPTGAWRAIGPGTAVVRATYRGFEAKASFEVLPDGIQPTVLLVEPSEIELGLGGSATLRLQALFSDGSIRPVSARQARFSTTSRAVTIDADGQVRGVAAGEFLIVIEWRGLGASVRGRVLEGVPQLIELRFEPPFLELGVGDSQRFRVVALDRGGAQVDVTFDPRLVLPPVGPNGIVDFGPGWVTARAPGEVRITAFFENLAAELTVRIAERPPEFVRIIITVPNTIQVGERGRIVVGGFRSDGTSADLTNDPNLVLTIADPAILERLGPDAVLGRAVGTSQIFAKYFGLDAVTTVRVVAAPDPVVGLEFVPSFLEMTVGEVREVEIIATYASGARRNVTFDPGITGRTTGPIQVTPSQNAALVLAQAEGRATADVTFEGHSAHLDVVIRAGMRVLIGLELRVPSLVFLNQPEKYEVVAVYSDGARANVTFEPGLAIGVSPPLARVQGGEIVGLRPGRMTVQFSYQGLVALAEIEVRESMAGFVRIFFQPPRVRLPAGGSVADIRVYGVPAQGGATVELTNAARLGLQTIGPIDVRIGPFGIEIVALPPGGPAQLVATFDGLTAVLPIEIVGGPSPLVGIRVEPPFLSLPLGQSQALIVVGTFADGHEEVLQGAQLRSDAPMVASIGPGQIVFGQSIGRAVIFVTYQNFTATVEVLVEDQTMPVPIGLRIEPDPIVVPVGGAVQPIAWVLMSDGTERRASPVRWRIDDPRVASLSRSGQVLGVGPGTTVLHATALGVSGQALVEVRPSGPEAFALDPSTIAVGAPDTEVRVFGSFEVGDIVLVNGRRFPTRFDGPKQLTFTAPAALLQSPGQLEVTVQRPSTGESTPPLPLLVGSPPRVFGLNPFFVSTNGDHEITAFGQNLQGVNIYAENGQLGVCCQVFSPAGDSVTFRVQTFGTGLGIYRLVFENALGSSRATLLVIPNF